MRKFNILDSISGAVSIVFAISLLAILAVTGLAVDIGRLYAVRSVVQEATDAALLGAMKTIYTNPNVEAEFQRFFFANYPRAGSGIDGWYMNSRVLDIKVAAESTQEGGVNHEVYNADVRVSVPLMIMPIFGQDYSTVTASASVLNNTNRIQKRGYIAFALDVTGSMCLPNCVAMETLKAATESAIEILSGGRPTLENIWVSIVPYTTGVAFDLARTPGAASWIRPPWDQRAALQLAIWNKVIIANRNPDKPADPDYDDTSEALPTTDNTKFRTPQQLIMAGNPPVPQPQIPHVPGIGTGAYWGQDLEGDQQTAIFLEQDKAALFGVVNGLAPGSYTRINTGLGWSFRAMLRNWENLLRPGGGSPILPTNYNENNIGYVILMTDGENSVYLGQESTTSDDNDSTLALCAAIKARSIKLFVIGLGTSINTTLLTQCASANGYYHAPDPAALRPIFENLAVVIKQELGLRLVH